MSEQNVSIRGDKLWGATEISNFLNASTDTVHRWSRDPSIPIYKPPGSGRLFAFRSELGRWLKTKAEQS